MIKELENCFRLEGGVYLAQVSASAEPSPAKREGDSATVYYERIPTELQDHKNDEPERLVRPTCDHFHPRFPVSIDAGQWTEFTDNLLAWGCEHRAAAALHEHRG